MLNRQLSASELETLARPLLAHVQERLNALADGNAEVDTPSLPDLRWGLSSRTGFTAQGNPMAEMKSAARR